MNIYHLYLSLFLSLPPPPPPPPPPPSQLFLSLSPSLLVVSPVDVVRTAAPTARSGSPGEAGSGSSTCTTLASLRWTPRGRPDKGKVDGDGAVEQFRVVSAVDGGSSFIQRRVLDESVTLQQHTRWNQITTLASRTPVFPLCPRERGWRGGGGGFLVQEARAAAAQSLSLLITHLDVTRPSIQVQMQVLDLAVVAKLVADILLRRLLVHVAHDHDPALDRPHRDRAHLGARARAVTR